MNDRKIFLLIIFFVIKYFRFYFFFLVKIATPRPEKSHPFFPSNPHLKVEVLSRAPLFENLVWGSTPRCRKGGDAHYCPMMEEVSLKIVSLINIIKHTFSWHDIINLLYIHPEDIKTKNNKKVVQNLKMKHHVKWIVKFVKT